ncbi:MAG: DUF2934 domain-containing protein [Pseudomonadota bacterium]
MSPDEQRIRARAYQLWEEEGRPEGRAESHWTQAREIIALEDNASVARRPLASDEADQAEPIEALTNLGEFPTLTDQGEMQPPVMPSEEPLSTAEPAAPDIPARRR